MEINIPQNFYHVPKINAPCYIVNITSEHGIWQSDNPLSQAIPLMAIQLSIVIAINQVLYFCLKPLHVPRIASDILAGVLLGRTAFYNLHYIKMVFPLRGLLIMETVGHWVLCLYLFLLGLSTDISAVFRTGKKATFFASYCLLIPFILGIVIYFLIDGANERGTGCFFFGAALAVTGFPVVARVLSDLRIIHSDMGRLALSTSLINDLASWVLISILLPSQVNILSTFLTFASTLMFTAFCYYCVRPCLAFLIRKSSKDKVYTDLYLNFVLASVSVFACWSDALGTSPMVGAFVYGLVMPSRELAGRLLETFEDCVYDYLMPMYFSVVGIRVDFEGIENWGPALWAVVLACCAKVGGGVVAAFFYGMSKKEGLLLGVAMNCKSIVVLIILDMGYDVYGKHLMAPQAYSIAVFSVVLMTTATPFILRNLYRPGKRLSNYQGRTIQKSRNDVDFRILACFQGPQNVSGMINLLDSSNATKESPLFVAALNLVELNGRNSSMLIVHNSSKSTIAPGQRDPNIEQIITAVETYANLNEGLVSVQPMTLLSPYHNMHEDICSLAEDKHATLIILPFHKQPGDNGTLVDFDEGIHFRGVNINILGNAPCTVGIFVDKGFGMSYNGESNLRTRQVAMTFIGGPDDREALAYSSRIGKTPGLSLTVIRFLPGDNFEEYEPIDLPAGDVHRMLTSISYVDKQRRLDDECIDAFRLKFTGEEMVNYMEKFVNNEEEMVSALKEIDQVFDLYIVGKGEGIISPLTAGLMDWCEFQELGALGDLFVTSSFARQGSVLVIQQYVGAGDLANLLASTREQSTRKGREQFGNWDHQEEEDGGLEIEPFATHDKKIKDDD